MSKPYIAPSLYSRATTSLTRSAPATMIRNTYALLSITLFWTAACSALGMALNISPGANLGLVLLGLVFLILTMVNSRKEIGLLWLFAFTGCEGLSFGPTLSAHLALPNGAAIIGLSAGLTGAVFLGLTAYAMISRRDFSFLGGFLFAGLAGNRGSDAKASVIPVPPRSPRAGRFAEEAKCKATDRASSHLEPRAATLSSPRG